MTTLPVLPDSTLDTVDTSVGPIVEGSEVYYSGSLEQHHGWWTVYMIGLVDCTPYVWMSRDGVWGQETLRHARPESISKILSDAETRS